MDAGRSPRLRFGFSSVIGSRCLPRFSFHFLFFFPPPLPPLFPGPEVSLPVSCSWVSGDRHVLSGGGVPRGALLPGTLREQNDVRLTSAVVPRAGSRGCPAPASRGRRALPGPRCRLWGGGEARAATWRVLRAPEAPERTAPRPPAGEPARWRARGRTVAPGRGAGGARTRLSRLAAGDREGTCTRGDADAASMGKRLGSGVRAPGPAAARGTGKPSPPGPLLLVPRGGGWAQRPPPAGRRARLARGPRGRRPGRRAAVVQLTGRARFSVVLEGRKGLPRGRRPRSGKGRGCARPHPAVEPKRPRAARGRRAWRLSADLEADPGFTERPSLRSAGFSCCGRTAGRAGRGGLRRGATRRRRGPWRCRPRSSPGEALEGARAWRSVRRLEAGGRPAAESDPAHAPDRPEEVSGEKLPSGAESAPRRVRRRGPEPPLQGRKKGQARFTPRQRPRTASEVRGFQDVRPNGTSALQTALLGACPALRP